MERLDQVLEALVEQRTYTEFAFDRLNSKVDAGFANLDAKIDTGLAEVTGRFARLERKLDQFIDLHVSRGVSGEGSQSE